MEEIFEQSFAQVGNIRLHLVQAGPKDGTPLILLHGFPEFWYGWRKQISPLADAGFRVIVPDQRGYNLSDKPKGLSPYRLDVLAQDVINLMDALKIEKASVCGHDWGGVVAWAAAALNPDRIQRICVMDAPYPPVMTQNFFSHPRQILKSSYIFFFQIPILAEWVLRRQQWKPLVDSLQRTSPQGTFSDEDIQCYRGAWQRVGAMTAMLNWYRALVWTPSVLTKNMRISQPALILWGAKDFALGIELAEASNQMCENGHLEVFERAGHWIQHEEPARVYNHLTDFFQV